MIELNNPTNFDTPAPVMVHKAPLAKRPPSEGECRRAQSGRSAAGAEASTRPVNRSNVGEKAK